ncbi:hypothetical protein DFP72DRAFT_1058345 [Ephemerocybe angulata]|uniref:Uncharacterized protein n=1 Tax=Ephemerocybe angulata TaxID=980116 RepID=A0A8H6MHN8_9AGAR|nr:hypothetical protein DFP72DRAFT_1058345 [Tulosesus angulatus]
MDDDECSIVPTSDPTEIELELPQSLREPPAMQGQTMDYCSGNSKEPPPYPNAVWNEEDQCWDPVGLDILWQELPMLLPRVPKRRRLTMSIGRSSSSVNPAPRMFQTVSIQTDPLEIHEAGGDSGEYLLEAADEDYLRSQALSPESSLPVTESYPGQLYTPVESLPVIFGFQDLPTTLSELATVVLTLQRQNHEMSTALSQKGEDAESSTAISPILSQQREDLETAMVLLSNLSPI